MKNYFKIMLDSKNRIKYAEECLSEKFIGGDYGVHSDLTSYLSDGPGEFINKFIPLYLGVYPGKSKEADRVGEVLWAFCKGIQKGDIVVCPNGRGVLYFGEVIGDYSYHPENILQHRRAVKWFPSTLRRANISALMKESLKVKSTSIMITQHGEEIEKYIRDYEAPPPPIVSTEKLLEDFLVENWKQTELGKLYDILEEDGEIVGQQYPTKTGPIDILAISKDKKELLVVELKKGRASDKVVGQIQRYMGFVHEKVAGKDQLVRGIIIASEDDKRIRSALRVTKNIEFYRYHVSIKLIRDSDA